jgi:hypothetical protein
VPKWVNREKVKVVLHKDFIPEEYLPTFCSTTIEMFLGFIPGLPERFIYANDDIFALNLCQEKDFFVGDIPVLNYTASSAAYRPSSQYERHLVNSLRLASKAAGIDRHWTRVTPKHNLNSMTVSSYKKVWEVCGDEIKAGLSKFREDYNHNQYLFSFYDFVRGHSMYNQTSIGRYLCFSNRTPREVAGMLTTTKTKMVCVNDADVTNFESTKNIINEAFQKKFPYASRYELPSPEENSLKVHLYTLCYNEIKLLPFAVDYWKTIADQVFVLDNGSTDGSVEYLKTVPNVHVVNFTSDGFNDDIHKRLKNEVWKASRGKADFVVVCDLDEFMYSPRGIRNTLKDMKRRGYTICKPIGYNMVSETFPEKSEKLLWEVCSNGFRDKTFDKVTIFNPNEISEMKYGPGAHLCSPRGNVVWYDDKDVYLLHYKWLSLQYVLDRYKEYSERMSKINIEKKWGVQYSRPIGKTKSDFNKNLINSKKII